MPAWLGDGKEIAVITCPLPLIRVQLTDHVDISVFSLSLPPSFFSFGVGTFSAFSPPPHPSPFPIYAEEAQLISLLIAEFSFQIFPLRNPAKSSPTGMECVSPIGKCEIRGSGQRRDEAAGNSSFYEWFRDI